MSERLIVNWGDDTVGYIYPMKRGRLMFQYDHDWIAKKEHPISLAMPCWALSFETKPSTEFFENLLPENAVYDAICQKSRIDKSDIYTFLGKYGQDCAGALSIVPDGQNANCADKPSACYREVTTEIEQAFENDAYQAVLIADINARLSIAGAQDKLPVVYEDGHFFIPEEGSGAPTSHILKSPSLRFPDLHRNEHFCMELAKLCGLCVPPSQIITLGTRPVYLVSRYDRINTGQGIMRIHQEDFCQALGYGREKKYEENGGPGFKQCFELLFKQEITQNLDARNAFVQTSVYNYIIGNCDAHAKNFSLLHFSGEKIVLAPCYDLVSTRAYPNLDQKYAMAFGKTYKFDKIAEHSWTHFSQDASITLDRLKEIALEMTESIKHHFQPLLEKHKDQYGDAPLYNCLHDVIKEGINHMEKSAAKLNQSTEPGTKKVKLK